MIKKLKKKWQIFNSPETFSDFELEHQRELKTAQDEMEANYKAVLAMMKTGGFKLFYSYLQARREVLRDKLERKEDEAIRAELKAIRSEIQFFDNWSNAEV